MAYKDATCRGSYALGTACGHCEKCVEERSKLDMIMPGTVKAAVFAVDPSAVADGTRTEMEFIEELNPVCVWRFRDGSVLKSRVVLIHCERIEGCFNPDGTPMYNLSWQQVITIVAPEELKRKP